MAGAVAIPEVNLADFVLRRAAELSDKPALVEAGLADRGRARGDTVCVCLPNVPEFAVAFHCAIRAGLRCATANPLYTARELGHELDTDARVVVTVPEHLCTAPRWS